MKITLNAFGLDISVNLFKGGASFGFSLDGIDYSHGILYRGVHEFGKAVRQEDIVVTAGKGSVGQKTIDAGSILVFPQDQNIIIHVLTEWMTYTCKYSVVHM